MKFKLSVLFEKIRNRESNIFDNFILIVISFSAVIIGLETNQELYNKYSHLFHLIDLVILCIFVFEVFFKWYAFYPNPWRYFLDGWNIFDFSIVVVSALPVFFHLNFNSEAIILLRVLRLARVLRVFRFISVLKPLQMLVSTLLKSLPSMGYVALLILILFYVYGVIGVFIFSETDPEHYSSLSMSVLTLFQTITGEGWPDLLNIQIQKGNIFIASVYYISFIVIGSMIILNLFIGVIVSELESLRDADARGRESIFEENHIVIIGWNSRVLNLVREIAEFYKGKKKVVVFLSETQKNDMQHYVKENLKIKTKLNFIYRNGSGIEKNDLHIVNLDKSESIIILSKDNANSDSYLIKVLLSIKSYLNQEPFPKITLPLKNPDNYNIVKMIAGDSVHPVLPEDLTARFIAQTSRQPGLSYIYNELLSFYGNEIYSVIFRELNGKKFYDIVNCFPESSVIGIRNQSGVILNPAKNYIIKDNDEVIGISYNFDSFKYKSNICNKKEVILPDGIYKKHTKAESVLIIGANDIIYSLLKELESYLGDSSYISVYYNKEYFKFNKYITQNPKIDIKKYNVNTSSRNVLEKIDYDNFDYIIILSYKDHFKLDESDSISFISLMYIRDILKKRNLRKSITTEMLSNKNEELIHSNENDDFIISSRLDSLLLAQYSQNPYLSDIYNELFDEKGSEIYLKPVTDYINISEKYSIKDICRICIHKGELFIGYKIYANNDIVINPNKKTQIDFSEKDRIIVISKVEYIHEIKRKI